jgi:hypothetical protein
MNDQPTTTPKSRRRYVLAGLLALLFGVTAAATLFAAGAMGLGGDSHDVRSDPEGPGFEFHATVTTTFPPVETPAATQTPKSEFPPAPPSAVSAAMDAALRYFNATNDPAVCNLDPPRKQDCIFRLANIQDSPERGVAAFSLGFAEFGGAEVVFGRDQAGGWQFWFGTQQQIYHALKMPAEMRVCADGQGANVRVAPDVSAKSAGLLKENAIVTAQQFVLTQPGARPGEKGPSGNGWYEVTGAFNGFVRADLLSVASLPDCSLRNALVKTP